MSGKAVLAYFNALSMCMPWETYMNWVHP